MNNKQIIWNFLKSKGFTDEQTAGIMGNIEQESNYDPKSVNSSSGAYGLFQWLGSRKTDLQNYAKKQGKPASDINVQLNFFWEELNGSESYTLTRLQNNKSNSASTYAVIFENAFERSGGSQLQKRKDYAESVLTEMTGTGYKVPQEIVDIVTPSGNNLGLKWWGDIVKVVFVVLILIAGIALLALAVGGGKVYKPVDIVKGVVK